MTSAMEMTERMMMIIIMMMMAMVMMKTMLTMKITVAIIKQKNQTTWMWTWLCYDHDHVHAKMSLRANRSFDILTACFLLTCWHRDSTSCLKSGHCCLKSICGLFYPWLDRENPLWRIEPTQIQVMQHKQLALYSIQYGTQSPVSNNDSQEHRTEGRINSKTLPPHYGELPEHGRIEHKKCYQMLPG